MKILNRVAVYLTKHLRSLKREIIITVIIFFFLQEG